MIYMVEMNLTDLARHLNGIRAGLFSIVAISLVSLIVVAN